MNAAFIHSFILQTQTQKAQRKYESRKALDNTVLYLEWSSHHDQLELVKQVQACSKYVGDGTYSVRF